MGVYDHRRAVRILSVILAVAVVVSIIHYTDNYVNYHDYPRPRTGPNPSASLVLGGWPGATSMPWWRQAHVCFDITCGIAVFSFAMWAARAHRHGPVSLTPQQAAR